MPGLTLFGQLQTKGKLIEVKPENGYAYVLHQPAECTSSKPLIVFLHGSGEKGDDLELVKVHGPLKYLKTNYLDAYVLAPQCPQNEYWQNEKLDVLIKKIISEYKIDLNCIHLTGLSMGAWGAWNYAVSKPEILASLVPIAGFVDRIPMLEACKLKDTPVRIYHGLLDDVVDIFYSNEIYKRLRICSQKVELTIFEGANHDSWTQVYNDPNIYSWMLANRKTE
ncbi:MAG TPA: phospholipase [Saprospirales bacterium]|nr:phospholipase [Saprospirales bacterium]